ncbi:MAG: hypothetical protein JWM99_3400 [Verrucomicrobiales bacterium]|jgi:uncharacterized protein (DUF58 family)|nr:hypothetical protein [Verrucomicrobiales bacterium]
MPHVSDFLSPVELQRFSNLQVVARLVVEGVAAGLHQSPHKGLSLDFAQHRAYVPGDEIRRLDWKVFGKTDRFYIREYEEETNLRTTILLDSSGSMAYGREVTKHHYAVRLAASLAYLMIQQQDSVGMAAFDRKLRDFVPPRSGSGHLRLLLEQLKNCKPGGETRLAQSLVDLAPRLQKRGLLILISDCFDNLKALIAALAHFRSARHEIILFQIWDPDELEFPFSQWTRFESLEGGDTFQTVDPAQIRSLYLKNLAEFRARLEAGCQQLRIDLVPVVTNRPYADILVEYLAKRFQRP